MANLVRCPVKSVPVLSLQPAFPGTCSSGIACAIAHSIEHQHALVHLIPQYGASSGPAKAPLWGGGTDELVNPTHLLAHARAVTAVPRWTLDRWGIGLGIAPPLHLFTSHKASPKILPDAISLFLICFGRRINLAT